MKYAEIVLQILGQLYREFLREMLLAAVKATPAKWDDSIIEVLDFLFAYKAPRARKVKAPVREIKAAVRKVRKARKAAQKAVKKAA